jgi:protein gp37
MIGTRGLHYIRHGVPRINAVILGGETGKGARPMHPDWVRSVRDQCEAAGVPFFFKGMLLDKKHKTMYIDGKTHTELPWRSENAIQRQGSSKIKGTRKKTKMD